MGYTVFNWNELLFYGRKDTAAIICLTYAQTKLYDEISATTMMRKLVINRVPLFLFQAGLFQQAKRVLICTYKTQNPQSYIKNPRFLRMGAPLRDKIVYLKALSMRRISDNNDYIPLKFYHDIPDNLFTKIENDRILFPYESRSRK